MKPRRSDFVIGISAIVFLGLFLGTILFLNPFNRVKTYRISVQFKHSEGLAPVKPGSPVLLSGAVQVGSIVALCTEQVLVPLPDGKRRVSELMIVVEAEIDAAIQLHADCQITTDQPAVGGIASLVILDIGTQAAAVVESQRIQGLPPQSLAATISTLSRRLLAPEGLVDKLDHLIDANAPESLSRKLLNSLADINAITTQLRDQLSPLEQGTLMNKLQLVFDNVSSATGTLRAELSADRAGNVLEKVNVALDRLVEGLTEMSALVRENRAPLTETVGHVQSVAEKLDQQGIDKLLAELNRDDPTSMLGKIHVSMDHVNQSLADVADVTASGREVVLLSRPALERTVANVKEMSEQLRLAGEELRLAPWRLMYRPTPKEQEKMSIFEAARTFAEAATYLDDASARLEAAATAVPASAADTNAQLTEIRQSLREAFERFKKAEDYLFKKMQ